MERLKGKSVLIGKEPGRGRLMIALEMNVGFIGAEGSVPNCVSRCLPAEGVAHARLSVDPAGHMTLTNLKPQNVTYVNGKEIMSKRISTSDSIALGKDMFTISITLILDIARKIAVPFAQGFDKPSTNPANPQPVSGQKAQPSPKYNISHLKRVYDDYEKEMEEIARRQQDMNKKRMLPIMIGSFSGLASPILLALEFTSPLFFTVPVAALSFGLYFANYRKKDTSYDDRKAALEKFTDNYVCPNGNCNKFLGNISYKLLKRQHNMHCPYCKCEFVEN